MSAPADHLRSRVLSSAGFRHAFFTRRGGVSSGPYTSLNFSLTVGDQAESVAENLQRASAVLGVEAGRVLYLSQVHGRNVIVAPDSATTRDISRHDGDALVSADRAAACGVRTADCVPILIGERQSGLAAAVHAGWRGVVARVVEAALTTMRLRIGGDGDFVAAIGPHISVKAFEVSDDVAAELTRASPNPDVIDRGRGPRPYVDLRAIVRAQLEELDVAPDAIDDVLGCTVSDPDLYFSFRRDGARSGRHLSAIVPRG